MPTSSQIKVVGDYQYREIKTTPKYEEEKIEMFLAVYR